MITYESLNQKEQISILRKAAYIEKHSEAILKCFSKDEKYISHFLEYLISEYETEYLPDDFLESNISNYYRSFEVIHKVCYFIKEANFSEQQKEAFRNKIREYPKHFKTPKKKYQKEGNQFVKLYIDFKEEQKEDIPFVKTIQNKRR